MKTKLSAVLSTVSALRTLDSTLGLTPALVLVKLMTDHPRSSRIEDIARDLELPTSTVTRSLHRLAEGAAQDNVGKPLHLATCLKAERINGRVAPSAWSLTPEGAQLRTRLLA